MKVRYCMLLMMGFAASFTAPIAATAQPSAAMQDAAPGFSVETATPAMWRVQDADSDYVLLGTFHILPPALDWRTAALQAAFEEAETVYFEVDADAPDAAPKTLNVVMTQGFNAPEVTLSSMLEAGDAKKLREISTSLQLPFAAIDTMRPWNAFLTLSVQFIISKGFEPGAGVDSVLLKEAKLSGQEVRFFETIEEQLALFTGLDPETEKKLLTITVRDWDEQEQSFETLFKAWARGDVDYIDVQMNDDMREQAPEVYDRLIVERNLLWAEELDAALKNEAGKGFVAVGAAHLAGGEFSVPALLAAKGYDVTRYGVESGLGDDTEASASEDVAPANDNTPTE
ncbi:MAG: TraB/GumN family protein [Pseudomonadota bacterium]